MQERLQHLKAFGSRLGETLERTAEELRATGLIPSAELIADLQSYRHLFQGLQSRLASQPGAVVVAASGRRTQSVEDLTLDYEGTIAARQVLEFLDCLRLITHTEGRQHPVVATCERLRLETMEAVRAADPNSFTVIQTVISGQHPLCAMSHLLNHAETLSDDQWTDLLERVADHLGREVSIAVARRKLFIPTADNLVESPLDVSQN